MFNDISTPLALLATRRSGKARDLVAPGPDDAQLAAILRIAARTPDHGKLFPWRFTIVPRAARAALQALLEAAHRDTRQTPGRLELDSIRDFAYGAPALVVVTSTPIVPHKIPVWEQELSAGAATMNLIHAAHAMGFAANWLTGWPAYAPRVLDALAGPGARIAGFVFIGTPSRELEERPRPDLAAVTRVWEPDNTG